MALLLQILLALTVMLCASLQEGAGIPLSGQTQLSRDPAPHRVRTKRCSCNNELDSECHYFCHLDIIWVNTPSKMTVYGLGSPLSRRRRSTGRCGCANPADRTCTAFCHNSSENAALLLVNPSTRSWDSSDRTSPDLLASLRDVVRVNTLVAELGISPRKKPSRSRKPRNR